MSDRLKDTGFFAEVDDDLDDAFLSQPRPGAGGYGNQYGRGATSPYGNNDNYNYAGGARTETQPAMTEAERRQHQLMAEIDRIQQNTLDSSKRSLRMVAESEQAGVATAEELMQQRERLENCSNKVTEIDRSLRVSQKHINSIKSLFGGLKNMFSKTPPEGATSAASSSTLDEAPPKKSFTSGSSELAQAVQESQRSASYGNAEAGVHPAMRLRGLDQDDDAGPPMANGRTNEMSSRDRFKAAENQLDDNLDDLSSGLARLKGLALGLGDEIQDQNVMLDKLSDAVEHSDIGIKRQNKQMAQILKK